MKRIAGAHKQADPRTHHRLPTIATKRILIIEPEALVSWSLSTFMAKWFEISTAASADDAANILGLTRVQAMVISDEISDRTTENLIASAKQKNPNVRVVRIISDPNGKRHALCDIPTVEKPFDLAKLATLLLP